MIIQTGEEQTQVGLANFTTAEVFKNSIGIMRNKEGWLLQTAKTDHLTI